MNNNLAGRVLNDLQRNSNFLIFHPPSSTHFPHCGTTSSTLDIMLTNSSLDFEINSDHVPVCCSIFINSIEISSANSFDFKRANWKLFQRIINNEINLNEFELDEVSIDQIDNTLQSLTNIIISARNTAIPINQSFKSFDLSDNTLLCIRYRNNIRRQWQRCHDPVLL